MSATPRCEPLRELVWTPDGARTPEEEALLRAHLAECADCRAAVEASRQVAASLAALPTVAAPATLRERTLAELEARRAAGGSAAPAANGATPSHAPLPRLAAPRRRSLPIALRVALPLAATLMLAVVWWQSRVGSLAPISEQVGSILRDEGAGNPLALAPAETAAHAPPTSEAKEFRKNGVGPGAPAGAPVATGSDALTRGLGAPPGAPPPPGAAAVPEGEPSVDPRSAKLLAAATPADALRLVALERAARYGEVAERGFDQERRIEPDPKGGGGGGGEVRRDAGVAEGEKKRAALDELDGAAYAAIAPTELRYAEWTPTSPRERELLAEWSRRGAREGDLLVIDLAPEELDATRESRDGFVDFVDDDGRLLEAVDDPALWWKATWRADDVAKLKGGVQSGEATAGDSKSGEAPPVAGGKDDAPARPTATGAPRGQNKAKSAPEPAAKPAERTENAKKADGDEEARAAEAPRRPSGAPREPERTRRA